MMKIGYTHGRYQPLHNGHFALMLKILEEYEQLWVGIANPLRDYPRLLNKEDKKLVESLARSRARANNPFNYIEREDMIISSLDTEGVPRTRFRVLPHFAFYETTQWLDFLPPQDESIIVLVCKDYHHYEKVERYRKAGWHVVFATPTPGVSGEILDSQFPDGPWRSLVPCGTVAFLERMARGK